MHEDKTHNSTVSAADLEQNTRGSSFRKNENKEVDTRCSINIHSVRKRLVDCEGVSGKAAVDGLVHGGVLEDDSAKFVKKYSQTQEKAKGLEYTIIEIKWGDYDF